MAVNVLEVLEQERMASKEKREQAQRAAEWYVEHKYVLREKTATYLEAGLRFGVSEWAVKDAVRKMTTEARIRVEREESGE